MDNEMKESLCFCVKAIQFESSRYLPLLQLKQTWKQTGVVSISISLGTSETGLEGNWLIFKGDNSVSALFCKGVYIKGRICSL